MAPCDKQRSVSGVCRAEGIGFTDTITGNDNADPMPLDDDPGGGDLIDDDDLLDQVH